MKEKEIKEPALDLTKEIEDSEFCNDWDDDDYEDDDEDMDLRYVEEVTLQECINGNEFVGMAKLDDGEELFFDFVLTDEADGFLFDVDCPADPDDFWLSEELRLDLKEAICEEIYVYNGCDRLPLEVEIEKKLFDPASGRTHVRARIGEGQLRCEYNLHRHYYKLALLVDRMSDIYDPYIVLDGDYLAGNEKLFKTLTADEHKNKGKRRLS